MIAATERAGHLAFNLHPCRVALAPTQCLGRLELLGLVERLGLLTLLRGT
jgi:hypothetical protein